MSIALDAAYLGLYLFTLIFGAWAVSEGGDILGAKYDATIVGGFLLAWLNTAPETIFFITALESGNPNFAIGAMSGSVIVVCTIAVGCCIIFGASSRSSKSVSFFLGVRKQAQILGMTCIIPILVLIFGFNYYIGILGISAYGLFILYTLLGKSGSGKDEHEEEGEEEEEQPTWKGVAYLILGGSVIYIFSEPFITLVVKIGTEVHLNPIFLAFFFAPIASEAPEILESISLSRKGKLQNINIAFSNLIGGTISKTTLLLGVLSLYGVTRGFQWNSPSYTISFILLLICAASSALFSLTDKEHKVEKGYYLIALFAFCGLVQFITSYYFATNEAILNQ